MTTLVLWILLRILTSTFAAIISSLKPLKPVEMSVALFPPTQPISQWLERVFISPWLRWDVEWYQRIVSQGYSATDGTAQFHPLYPALAIPLASTGISPVLSLLLVSSLAGIGLFFYFTRLAKFDLQQDQAYFALVLMALAPMGLILFAPYPEALFLLLAVLSFYFGRNQSWWWAGLMGGLAALTRQQGLFLVFPLAWELWEYSERKWAYFRSRWRDWMALALIPTGYLVWLIYRAYLLNDLSVTWGNLHDFIYSFMVSPSASQVVPQQQFIWPWQALYFSGKKLATQPDLDIWVNTILALAFLSFLALTWKRMRISYRIYSLAIALLSFSYYTGPVHPYMGLPRHLYLAFPIYIALAGRVEKTWMKVLILSASSVGMLFLVIAYVLKAWVP